MKIISRYFSLALGGVLMLSSCTISEPEESSLTSADGALLSSITLPLMNYPLFKIEYDSSNRVTLVQCEDDKLEISYNPLTIIETETDEYWDSENDKEIVYVRNRTEFTNIRLNDKGYIVSMDAYDVGYWPDRYDPDMGNTVFDPNIESEERYTVTLTYNSAGELTRTASGPDDVTVLNWQNGLLVSYNDVDGSSRTEFEYSDVANVHRQWDPVLGIVGLFSATGFVGVAPVKWVSHVKEVDSYNNVYNEMYFSYYLNKAGLIEKAQNNNEDGKITLRYNYIKAK